MKKVFCSVLLAGVCVAFATPARAQSRPLVTEDPETVPTGFILLEAGIDSLNGMIFPASGLTGNQTRLATTEVPTASFALLDLVGPMPGRPGACDLSSFILDMPRAYRNESLTLSARDRQASDVIRQLVIDIR